MSTLTVNFPTFEIPFNFRPLESFTLTVNMLERSRASRASRMSRACLWNSCNSFSDSDGDNYIGTIDIENTAKLLTQNELSLEEIAAITDKVYL